MEAATEAFSAIQMQADSEEPKAKARCAVKRWLKIASHSSAFILWPVPNDPERLIPGLGEGVGEDKRVALLLFRPYMGPYLEFVNRIVPNELVYERVDVVYLGRSISGHRFLCCCCCRVSIPLIVACRRLTRRMLQ